MLLLLNLAVVSHVPTYGGSADGCFQPVHHHDVSQVTYGKGSGACRIVSHDITV